MREIKFRGKDDDGHWRYGDHVCHNVWSYPSIMEFYDPDYPNDNRFPVDPATVGQFTGLRDCKRREIYEGDILHITAKNPYRSPIDHKSVVTWGNCGWECFGEQLYDLRMRYSVTVIGNIHDNSELLLESNK